LLERLFKKVGAHGRLDHGEDNTVTEEPLAGGMEVGGSSPESVYPEVWHALGFQTRQETSAAAAAPAASEREPVLPHWLLKRLSTILSVIALPHLSAGGEGGSVTSKEAEDIVEMCIKKEVLQDVVEGGVQALRLRESTVVERNSSVPSDAEDFFSDDDEGTPETKGQDAKRRADLELYKKRMMNKVNFTSSFMQSFAMPDDFSFYDHMNGVVSRFLGAMEAQQENYFAHSALPLRALLFENKQIRDELAADRSGMDEKAKEAKLSLIKANEGRLAFAKPSQLMRMFLGLFEEDKCAVLISELSGALKDFVLENLQAEYQKRAKLVQDEQALSVAGAGRKEGDVTNEELEQEAAELEAVKQALSAQRVVVSQKEFSVEVLYRELSSLCHYQQRFKFERNAALSALAARAGLRKDTFGIAEDNPVAFYEPIPVLRNLVCEVGEPFELIDGN
jgi:hypothetical protein